MWCQHICHHMYLQVTTYICKVTTYMWCQHISHHIYVVSAHMSPHIYALSPHISASHHIYVVSAHMSPHIYALSPHISESHHIYVVSAHMSPHIYALSPHIFASHHIYVVLAYLSPHIFASHHIYLKVTTYMWCQHKMMSHSYKCMVVVRLVFTMAPTFSCPLCIDLFNSQKSLNRHLQLHDEDFYYSCSHCNFKTKRKDSLNRHVEKYHAMAIDLPVIVDKPPKTIDNNQPHETIQKPANNAHSSMHDENQSDKCLQLPNNFIYAGSSQSVSFHAIF